MRPTKQWIMALYLDGNDYGLFASPDLKKWERLCVVNLPGVSECPDLFPLSVDGDPANTKWVFWGANGNLPDWLVRRPHLQAGERVAAGGLWRATSMPPRPGATFHQADGRRIQIAWMAGGNYPGMPFTPATEFPHRGHLADHAGRAPHVSRARAGNRQAPPAEHTWANVVLKPGDNLFSGLTGDLFDIRAEFELGDAKSLGHPSSGRTGAVRRCREDALLPGQVGSRSIRRTAASNCGFSSDRTSLEVFGNDGSAVLTSCFLPSSKSESLETFTQGGNVKVISADVYPMKSICANLRCICCRSKFSSSSRRAA